MFARHNFLQPSINKSLTVRLPSPYTLKILVYYLIPIFLVICLYGLFSGPWLRLEQINCQYTDQSPCETVILAELLKYRHQFLLFINPAKIRQKLTSALPDSRQINVNLILPKTLTVTINRESPWITIKLSSSNVFYLTGRNLRIISQSTDAPATLPVISLSGIEVLTVGQTISDPSLIAAASILDLLTAADIPVMSIKIISADEIVCIFPDHRQGIFTGLKDLSRQVTALQLVLLKTTINSSLPIIDVRFDKPILKPVPE